MSRAGSTRFRKGQSGNPRGRPRKTQPPQSAFDIIIDRTLTVHHNGVERELSIDEALQHKTYQAAIAGNRSARREILKMIGKREQWLAANRKPARTGKPQVFIEHDPDNANDALLLLGIACLDPDYQGAPDPYRRMLIEPWAVEAALRRMRRVRLADKDLEDIRRCTRNPGEIQWR